MVKKLPRVNETCYREFEVDLLVRILHYYGGYEYLMEKVDK